MSPVRPNSIVEQLVAYVPGEQPREPGWVKLNTNESPFPPAPQVAEAINKLVASGDFQKYPDPVSSSLRAAVGESLHVSPNQVLIGNGSDEVLRLLCHAYLDAAKGDRIGMLYPTYSLYSTLAEMFGAGTQTFDLQDPGYEIPAEAFGANVRIFFLANPNPPIGTYYPLSAITRMAAARPDRLLVVDEAYISFAGPSAVELIAEHDNIVVSRTFSKSFGLAGLRVGFVVGNPGVIAELDKIRDSYNINKLSQVAAEAAWRATDYYQGCVDEIRTNREWLRDELLKRGFAVPSSSGNFVFARCEGAKELYLELKARKILVRYFTSRGLTDGVRISVGTREQQDALMLAIDQVRKPAPAQTRME